MNKSLVLFLIVSTICFGANWFVDWTMPDDTGNGQSWGTAEKNISAAYTDAGDGDTIYIKENINYVPSTYLS